MSNDTVYSSISRYAVSNVADKEAYAGLRKVAQHLALRPPASAEEHFRYECRDAEDEFMQVNYGNDPDAKHTKGKRKGQWKYRTYLPAAYSSAKSELAKALGAGIDVTDKGKTELAKARQAASKTPVPPSERIRKALVTIKNALVEMPQAEGEQELENIRRELGL